MSANTEQHAKGGGANQQKLLHFKPLHASF